MRIRDLKKEEVRKNIRVKSLVREVFGTIVNIDKEDDDFALIKWDDEAEPTSGFYGNDCDCEIGH